MYSDTLLVLNEKEKKHRYFKIEAKLRALSNMIDHNFIIALFDCCRQQITKDDMRGGPATDDEQAAKNIILTWGCPPSKGVPAKSSIVSSYSKYVVESIEGGVVVFPDDLIDYLGDDGNCETVPKCQ